MSKNINLHKAKKEANDEFYTQLVDIEKELIHYRSHFNDKVVFCNCDDPKESNFWKFFSLNFKFLNLKGLISTHYHRTESTYAYVVTRSGIKKIIFEGNGDFRSPESIELLNQSDIVVTNPPFSLFREYIDLLMDKEKKFLVIGNKNAATNDKNVFSHILAKKMWLGVTSPQDFTQPEGAEKKSLTGLCNWFTNLEHNRRKEELILFKEYSPSEYPYYDGTEIINVDRTSNIPKDYKGVMGVPISALSKINPEQFEIVGATNNTHKNCVSFTSYIKGKKTYARLLIKAK